MYRLLPAGKTSNPLVSNPLMKKTQEKKIVGLEATLANPNLLPGTRIPLQRIDFNENQIFWKSGDYKKFWMPSLFRGTTAYYNTQLGLIVVKGALRGNDQDPDLLFHPAGCRMIPE